MQVNKLVSLEDFISGCKSKPKKPIRNEKDRKKWIREHHPQVKFVKHPKTSQCMIAVEKETLMLVGEKTSAKREKKEEFDSKAEAKESLKRARENMTVESNQQARLRFKTIQVRNFNGSYSVTAYNLVALTERN